MPDGVVAGKVIEVSVHPNGEYIRLATVDIGPIKVQVVFGGPAVVAAGDLVPVALPGVRLPGRKKMRRTKFRGEVSHGMFCSTSELGWEADGPDEVALLKPDGLEPGSSLAHADLSFVRREEGEEFTRQRLFWQEHLRNATRVPVPAAHEQPPSTSEEQQAPVAPRGALDAVDITCAAFADPEPLEGQQPPTVRTTTTRSVLGLVR
jgi:tRNA-binding EMAP/Myf-like protein